MVPSVHDIARAAIAFEKAVKAECVFATFQATCETFLKDLRFCAYSVLMDGRTARLDFVHGLDRNSIAVENLDGWIIDGSVPRILIAGTPVADGYTLHRLVNEERAIGAVILFVSCLQEEERRLLDSLLALCASSLAALRQRRLSRLLIDVLNESEEAIAFYDNEDGVIFTNRTYHRIFPHYPDQNAILGYNHLDLYRLDLDADVIDDPLARSDPEAYMHMRTAFARSLVDRQREIQSIGGRMYIYLRSRSPGGATLSRRIDVTDQHLIETKLRERETELEELAYRDLLTGCRNRAFLQEHLARLNLRLERGTLSAYSVFLIDLNEFKSVNDSFGHDVGDRVLKIAADRIGDCISECDVIVRYGGDEFIVVSETKTALKQLDDTAERLIKALSEPILQGNRTIQIGCSVGIAIQTPEDVDTRKVLIDADLAMYEVKSRRPKRTGHALFRPQISDGVLSKWSLLEQLRMALANGEYEVFYQPQFETADLHLVGFEALLRWRNPVKGLISPGIFVPMLEEHDLIEAVGEWVLATACAEATRWPDHLTVAVNVSPYQAKSPHFALKLAETLMKSGLSPHRLELEITESTFLDSVQSTRDLLAQWKSLGVQIAIDDFGKGYSAFSYLGSFPLDKIKIDREFLANLDVDEANATSNIVLQSIIEMGRKLGLTVIAEGVEEARQLERLAFYKCPQVQGFLLGRPTSTQDLGRFFGEEARLKETA